MPKVSVIIPTYAHAALILQTLESVFAQSFTDYEVIVVNDGSPDHTEEVLKPLVEAGKIRYFEKTNGGVASARNLGIGKAGGKYIALLDDDDLWPATNLEWLVAELDLDQDIGLIGGTWVPLDADESTKGRFDPAWVTIDFDYFFGGNPFISPGQTLIRREVLEDVGGFDESLWGTDDLDLWMRVAARHRMKIVPMTALRYRFHEGNASRNLPRMAENFRRTVRKNLTHAVISERERLKWTSWMWLYAWIGKQSTEAFATALRSGSIRGTRKSFSNLKPFLVEGLTNRTLRSGIIKDFKLAWRGRISTK